MHTGDYWKGLCEPLRVSTRVCNSCEFLQVCEFQQVSSHFCECLWVSASFWKFLPIPASFCEFLRISASFCEFLQVSASFCQFQRVSASYFELLRVSMSLWKLMINHKFGIRIFWAKIAQCEIFLYLYFRMILQALQPQSRVSYFPWESSTFEFYCGLERVWKTIVFLLSRK